MCKNPMGYHMYRKYELYYPNSMIINDIFKSLAFLAESRMNTSNQS
jgi:hypothetical protein